MSPTQRTQHYLRGLGYIVANCERKIPCTPAGYRGRLVTQDLFEFIDTMAVANDHIIAVQSTDGTHHAHRVAKVLGTAAAQWLAHHMDIEVWSWSKRGARGKRKLWTLRRQPLTAALIVRGKK